MKTMAHDTHHLEDLRKALAEKLDAELVSQAVERLRPLLDEDGLHAYMRLVDAFTGVGPAFSVWLLQSGHRMLSALRGPEIRRAALEAILEMGKSKWSVVEHACKKIPVLSGFPDNFIVEWLRSGNLLADIDQDVAIQYFESSIAVYDEVGSGPWENWTQIGVEIAKLSWKAAKEYFKSSPEVVKKVDQCDLDRWARLGLYLIEKSPKVKAGYSAHSMLAQGTHAGKSKTLDLALQYFKSAPQILGRLSIHDLENWVEKGLEVTDEQKDKGTAYFSLQTGTSRKEMETLIKGLELKDVYQVLASYGGALFGRIVQIRSSSLFYKNLPGLSRFFSVTDGTRVFLPPRIDLFADQDLNFKVYKWILTHELGHLVFGSFDLVSDDLKQITQFQDPVPAFKIFEFLEDERIDHLMGLQYPGLEKDRRRIMEAYIERSSQRGEVRRSVFESLSYRVSEKLGTPSAPDCRLMQLLKEALVEVLTPGYTSRQVLDLTVRIFESLEGEASCEVCSQQESVDRIFYRGPLDYKLVEETRLGTSRLVLGMFERFLERQIEVKTEHVEKAIARLEEAEGPNSEVLLWQVTDSEQLDDMFEKLKSIVAEIEEESRFRRTVFYDEWDMKLEDYKKDWCRVREGLMPASSPRAYEKVIEEYYGLVSLLRRHFGLLRPDRIKRFFREERGDDLDIDAAIEAVVERYAGSTPSDRVYIRRDKKLRDVSVAFLVDMSYSTSEVLPSGKRIIDVEREGIVLMAEALESIGDQWAVYGFSSERRDKVDFFVIRDFNEPFSDNVKMRFDGIKPAAQTRLGTVIRHANKFLERQPSLIRLLILLSDGRPYDVDYGDVDYAIEDTRMALWEGRNKGINSFCITVDKKSRDYLPHMYGEANYTIIDNVESLPLSLPLIYKKLTT